MTEAKIEQSSTDLVVDAEDDAVKAEVKAGVKSKNSKEPKVVAPILSEEDQSIQGISDLLVSPEERKMQVRNPKLDKKTDAIFYDCQGVDSQG